MAYQRVLGAIFFFSGSAALIYQVCWQRLLSVYYGVGSVSTAIVVSIFMLGLGLGALAGGHLTKRLAPSLPLSSRAGAAQAGTPWPGRLIATYIAVEFLIGLFGVGSLHFLSAIGQYTAGSSYVMTAVYVSLFLLVPTSLMGMTLPLIVCILLRWSNDLLANLTWYYFINTVGAAFGAIFCSYVLISFLGIDGAVATAVVVNLLLAAALLFVSTRKLDKTAEAAPPVAPPSGPQPALSLILPLLFVGGFLAIGYQILWYRIIGVLLRDSPYSFATTLGIYLLGIGFGSLWLNARRLRSTHLSRFNLYLGLNILIGATTATSILLLYFLSAHWPISALIIHSTNYNVLPYLGEAGTWLDWVKFVLTLGIMAFWPSVLLLVPAFLMGAAFPLGISLIPVRSGTPGPVVGFGYALTIAGNTLGGLVTSFALLPYLGTVNVLCLFTAIQFVYPFLIRRHGSTTMSPWAARAAGLAGIAVLVALVPSSAAFYQRLHRGQDGFVAYFREGVEGVDLAFTKGSTMHHFINGSAHGGRPGPLFVEETITALSYAPSPKHVLVIGLGTGTIVETLKEDERVESIVVVELNRTVLDNLLAIPLMKDAVVDPRISYVVDDGRRFLQRTSATFDLIAIDTLRTRSAFSNNVYSVEFFRLIRDHLTPNGVFMLWNDDKTGGLAKTFATVFDHVDSYREFMIASRAPLAMDRERYARLLAALPPVMSREVALRRGPVVCRKHDILAASPALRINRDTRPHLEYYLGLIGRKARRLGPC